MVHQLYELDLILWLIGVACLLLAIGYSVAFSVAGTWKFVPISLSAYTASMVFYGLSTVASQDPSKQQWAPLLFVLAVVFLIVTIGSMVLFDKHMNKSNQSTSTN